MRSNSGRRRDPTASGDEGGTTRSGPRTSRWGDRLPILIVAPIALVVVGVLILALLAGPVPGVLTEDTPDTDPQPPTGCLDITGMAADAPSISGPALLSADELEAWWDTTGRDQPELLAVPVDELISFYLAEGRRENVRGDLAFAQAVLETGYFSNQDTELNNYAGIAHYDGEATGAAFDDVRTGVRAQIQLLKRFAHGNEIQLVGDPVAPEARASAATWNQLAGTWASDTGYWAGLSELYRQMVADAGHSYPLVFVDPANC